MTYRFPYWRIVMVLMLPVSGCSTEYYYAPEQIDLYHEPSIFQSRPPGALLKLGDEGGIVLSLGWPRFSPSRLRVHVDVIPPRGGTVKLLRSELLISDLKNQPLARIAIQDDDRHSRRLLFTMTPKSLDPAEAQSHSFTLSSRVDAANDFPNEIIVKLPLLEINGKPLASKGIVMNRASRMVLIPLQ